ncbi:FMN-binding negative transcriptional regulator [Alginatibacterium sediminis]|uniref:FMN-binding negative transcriptional regulator n=1 Tax=Alginatibacterium sediminis TaxID=2164068 RepID=A0A420EHF9_9ALTE|nr:FMN-binding negative transcriptional regulator [Alginatibacterium sediminis]RKF20094.1 FMN-binding negative transcriptional regulator [Alginatibacterium sediminis]
MLQAQVFREQRSDVMHDMIANNSFGSVITMQTGSIVADHLPLNIHPEIGSHGTLRGHIARSNPMTKLLDNDQEILIIFQGPQHYVSPSWYPSKALHEKVVPTWNYIMVHARGKVKFHDDADWIYNHLVELTARNEVGRDKPWKVSDAPPQFIRSQLKALTGIEIEITSLQGTWKTSQNKSLDDNIGVCQGLMSEGSDMATLMATQVVRSRN